MSQTQIIKELKEFLGFTNKSKATKQLSELLGVSTEAIYLWEKDKCKINVHKIIEKIPNISAEFLLGRSKEIEFKQDPENKDIEDKLQWFLRDETITKPYKNNESDTGYDIKWDGVLHNIDGSQIDAEAVVLSPLSRRTFGTGVSVSLPKGYGIQGRSRSGLSHKNGIQVLNSPGTIDNEYTGEIKVTLCNTSNESVTINKGDRIAQLVLEEIVVLNESVSYGYAKDFKVTDRGEKGFGDSGRQ